MNYNPENIIEGQLAILDRGHANQCEVLVVSITPNGMFATVCLPDDQEYKWSVMTNRLFYI